VIVLGVETSCDDTAAAVLEDGRERASVVRSQDAVHAPYGGVVPELAARNHIAHVVPVIECALERSGLTLDRVEGVAATCGPGLVGSLLVGLCAAKAIARARALPFVGVNHIEGHLLSIELDRPVPRPFLGLVVSGGHSALYWAPRTTNTPCSARRATMRRARPSTRRRSCSASAIRAVARSRSSLATAIRRRSSCPARASAAPSSI
jgi:glycoprotease/Kae1 family metallohydrolase